MTTANRAPIFLLADSQMLFWRPAGKRSLMERMRERLPAEPAAAYVGASNGDRPEFHALFEAAMDSIGLRRRRMIRSEYPAEDEEFLNGADLVLLAGGDVELGWTIIVRTGMREAIVGRHARGAVLVGVSAGAVQLGRGARRRGGMLEVLGLTPLLVDVHDEQSGWEGLRSAVAQCPEAAVGVGIPSGGALVCHETGLVEPVRFPVAVVRKQGPADTPGEVRLRSEPFSP